MSFDLHRGRTIGAVGESGSGKSAPSRSIMRLLPSNARMGARSEALPKGRDLAEMPKKAPRRIREPEVSIIFQNPVMTLGESLTHRMGMSRKQARARSLDLLAAVGPPQPDVRAAAGGHRHRAGLEAGAADRGRATALDVTVQAEILDLLQRQQQERDMGRS